MTFKTECDVAPWGALGKKGDIGARAHHTVGPTSPRVGTTLPNNALGRNYLFGTLEKIKQKKTDARRTSPPARLPSFRNLPARSGSGSVDLRAPLPRVVAAAALVASRNPRHERAPVRIGHTVQERAFAGCIGRARRWQKRNSSRGTFAAIQQSLMNK